MDRRRIVWPQGSPQEAVVTRGFLARWWVRFCFGTRKLRRVNEAWGPLVNWSDPIGEAERAEIWMRDPIKETLR